MARLGRSALTRIADGRFRVDFERLRPESLRDAVGRLVKPSPVEIDPYLVGRAIRATMRRCSSRNVGGQPLVWNEYKLFLSPADYDRLRPMTRGIDRELGAVIEDTLAELGADTPGDPVVRILVDDEVELPAGVGEIVAAFVDNARLAPGIDGQVTVRMPRSGRAAADGAPPPGGAGIFTGPNATRRVPEPDRDEPPPDRGWRSEALRLEWKEGAAEIAPYRTVEVGRPRPGSPADDFIPLTGAGRRINSRHLEIENTHRLVIRRPAAANPVQVDGRLLRPGGRLELEELPAVISLSNGELVLTLRREAG